MQILLAGFRSHPELFLLKKTGSEIPLPFTEPVPIPAHGLMRKLAPLMLMVYRRRDAREIA